MKNYLSSGAPVPHPVAHSLVHLADAALAEVILVRSLVLLIFLRRLAVAAALQQVSSWEAIQYKF